jgi:hypothetical protein
VAHCVISRIVDTDAGNAIVPGCAVHAAFAPCMHDGEPASPVPLHTFDGDRDEAIRMWRLKTHRQRPLIVHDMTRITDPHDHVFENEVLPCPCSAEVLAAEVTA